jgi:hypothetical protein
MERRRRFAAAGSSWPLTLDMTHSTDIALHEQWPEYLPDGYEAVILEYSSRNRRPKFDPSSL